MNRYNFNPQKYHKQIYSIIQDLETISSPSQRKVYKVIKKYPKDNRDIFSKDQIISGYNYLVQNKHIKPKPQVLELIRMKPTRSQSGIASVTVLTKPYPCPGQCIFCPNDIRMPKSYIASEPGCQRAEMNSFDPYLQTFGRLKALDNIGHSIEKIELIVLGGTWSSYPDEYQIWFIGRCFEAMNDYGVKDQREEIRTKIESLRKQQKRNSYAKPQNQEKQTYNKQIVKLVQNNKGFFEDYELSEWGFLEKQHKVNETARCRCVGLSIETRPDSINKEEVIKIRKLGATKVQIGIQSLNDKVLKMNKRGHDSQKVFDSIKLLRLAGFKIHAHWMPNLYGSNLEIDKKDFLKLWGEKISPDELKIYPTSVIPDTELYEAFKDKKYKPYTHEELLDLITHCFVNTPRYCRLTRVIRDIPAQEIAGGNKYSHFRQIVEENIKNLGLKYECIRTREIKSLNVNFSDLELEKIHYKTSVGDEYFLSYKTVKNDHIAGFLRLSLPNNDSDKENFINEIKGKAMIREIHIYGRVAGIKDNNNEENQKAQHIGLGKKLIQKAKEIAKAKGYSEISVISAIGTKEYYKKRGFVEDGIYMSSTTKS